MPELPKSWQRMREAAVKAFPNAVVVEDPGELEQLKRISALGAIAEGIRYNIAHPNVPETPEEMMKALVENPPLLPLGMLKPLGVGKSLLLRMKAGVGEGGLRETFNEAMRIGQGEWKNVRAVEAVSPFAHWSSVPKATLNVGTRQHRMMGHEFVHEAMDFPKDMMEAGMFQRMTKIGRKILTAHNQQAFGKSGIYWKLSPEEQLAIKAQDAMDRAVLTNQPFDLRRTMMGEYLNAQRSALENMDEYLVENLGGVTDKGLEAVYEAQRLYRKLLLGM